MGDNDMRFADQALVRFHQDFIDHVDRFKSHEENEHIKFNELIEAQHNNTKAITELTSSVSNLVDDTRDIIKLHQDFQGTVRIGANAQGFMLWLLKWGIVGAGLVAVIKWTSKHF